MKKGKNEEKKINNTEVISDKEAKVYKIANIVMTVVIVVAILISVDIVMISKYNAGPMFAIKTNTYKDGGTKVYYGLGYKVIKYHQVEGRRDTTVGLWTMPYSTTPTKISSLDLAIEFRNNPKKAYKKLAKQFLQVTGKVYKIDTINNILTLRYTDDGEKYNLDINCKMAEKNSNIDKFRAADDAYIIGTVDKYAIKEKDNKKSTNTLTMKNCFAK